MVWVLIFVFIFVGWAFCSFLSLLSSVLNNQEFCWWQVFNYGRLSQLRFGCLDPVSPLFLLTSVCFTCAYRVCWSCEEGLAIERIMRWMGLVVESVLGQQNSVGGGSLVQPSGRSLICCLVCKGLLGNGFFKWCCDR